VARFAGVSVPAVATVALARRSTNTAGLRVGRLVLVLQEGGLDPWCRAARLNGSFPQPRRPSAGDLERFGVSDLVADTAGSWRTCNGSHPGNNRVERDVLAHVAGDGVVTAHLLAYEMGR
jgi:hypothetical protein